MADAPSWWAKGLMFENCNCQLLCPAHLSFKQRCTHARCVGHWAIHVDEGRSADVALDGLNAVIVTDAPPVMVSGDWTQAIYLDDRADDAQWRALEAIFAGRRGGTWAVLARFVSARIETRRAPIRFRDEGRKKAMWVEGCFDSTVEAIRGADRGREAALENVFNQIHGPTQVLALGTTRYADRTLALDTAGTHALYSRFAWKGP